MDNINVCEIMKEWQKGNDKLVSIRHFTLSPQAQGFYLNCEFYVIDKYADEWDYESKDFFGELEECFEQALKYINDETERLKNLL